MLTPAVRHTACEASRDPDRAGQVQAFGIAALVERLNIFSK